jgi:hypothetical protein
MYGKAESRFQFDYRKDIQKKIDQPRTNLREGHLWMSAFATSSMIPTGMASAAPGLGSVLSMCELRRTTRDLPSLVPSDMRKTTLVRFWYDLYSHIEYTMLKRSVR